MIKRERPFIKGNIKILIFFFGLFYSIFQALKVIKGNIKIFIFSFAYFIPFFKL